ncbi:hypothetical protein D5R40_24925 [Okeania hirsuta]|uniref:Uncharacterized protein n=1 Tax=Okeania hirsuta TaxID=1458930 RepID=A0A3N6P5C4_9CYAN|nr:hypothetical protein D4Z78_02580 [Okeania hirsuta]RQH29193.1 hypothetical protein D5R40_24925 [Okeania hirsuta]
MKPLALRVFLSFSGGPTLTEKLCVGQLLQFGGAPMGWGRQVSPTDGNLKGVLHSPPDSAAGIAMCAGIFTHYFLYTCSLTAL